MIESKASLTYRATRYRVNHNRRAQPFIIIHQSGAATSFEFSSPLNSFLRLEATGISCTEYVAWTAWNGLFRMWRFAPAGECSARWWFSVGQTARVFGERKRRERKVARNGARSPRPAHTVHDPGWGEKLWSFGTKRIPKSRERKGKAPVARKIEKHLYARTERVSPCPAPTGCPELGQ